MAGYGSVESVHDSSSVEVETAEDVQAGAVEVDGDGPGGGPGTPAERAQFRWGWRHTLASILTILVGVIVAWFIQLPYYAVTPGAAPEVSSSHRCRALPTATSTGARCCSSMSS